MKRALPTILLLLLAISAASAAPPAPIYPGAKGMFYEQLQRPTEKLNTGIQYWIELKRKGQTNRVSNKFEFRSGDQIRFHVKSNANGFAYVVLREGSRGEQSVLFPDKRHLDDNCMKANVEYAIPGDSFLLFDEFPGTEKLTFVMARTAIEPNKFMPDTSHKVIVASRADGSKDLVPGSFVVSYGGADTPSTVRPASLPSPQSPANLPPADIIEASTGTAEVQNDDQSNAIITIVQKNPADALAVDIFLEHRP